jgi:hypothetical protein
MTFISAQGSFTRNGNSVLLNFPNLPVGAGTNLMMTVRVTPANTTITNTFLGTGTARSIEPELNPANNTATGTLTVYPIPHVLVGRKSGQVVLSWPAVGATNFYVEATDKLFPPAWVRLTNSPALSAGLLSITINPVKTNQFFRVTGP